MLNVLGYSCLLSPMLLQVTGKSLIRYTEVLRNLEVNLRPGKFNPVHGGEAGVRQFGVNLDSFSEAEIREHVHFKEIGGALL